MLASAGRAGADQRRRRRAPCSKRIRCREIDGSSRMSQGLQAALTQVLESKQFELWHEAARLPRHLPADGRRRARGALVLLAPRESRFAAHRADPSEFVSRASIAMENARLYSAVQEADRRKNEFLAMLAHELRNPLAPIRNALHILQRGDGDAAHAGAGRAT